MSQKDKGRHAHERKICTYNWIKVCAQAMVVGKWQDKPFENFSLCFSPEEHASFLYKNIILFRINKWSTSIFRDRMLYITFKCWVSVTYVRLYSIVFEKPLSLNEFAQICLLWWKEKETWTVDAMLHHQSTILTYGLSGTWEQRKAI